MSTGKLFVVATPIGNLGDMTARALTTLQQVDFVYCEDTRETQRLMHHFDLHTPLRSYHQHSSGSKLQEILAHLREGKNLALVTDAGTPGISDPGGELIAFLVRSGESVETIAIPGPSALAAAMSVAGFPTDKFLFLGFPPHKNKRQKFFEEVGASPYTVAFYESPYRIGKALQSLQQVLDPSRQLCICRELTKKFETVYRGTISEILERKIPEKGEFVVIVSS